MENVDFVFEDLVLCVVVKKVLDCNMGVRGLCFILENMLFEIMYDLLSCIDVGIVVVNEDVINGMVVLLFKLECLLRIE